MQSRTVNPEPDKQVWEPWQTVGFGLAIFIVYSIAQAVIAVIFIINKLSISHEFALAQLIKSISTNGFLIAIATIVSAVVGVGLIILFIKFRKGPTIVKYLGLSSISKKTILILLALTAGLLVLSSVLDLVLQKSGSQEFTLDVYRTSVWPALFGIAVVIFAPAFEEGFFRGFLFAGLKQSRIGSVGAIVLTALGWAALHIQYDIYAMAIIFILGIVLGIVRLKTGSLWSALFMHSLWNLAGVIGAALYTR